VPPRAIDIGRHGARFMPGRRAPPKSTGFVAGMADHNDQDRV
jgi:hypothetical protein